MSFRGDPIRSIQRYTTPIRRIDNGALRFLHALEHDQNKLSWEWEGHRYRCKKGMHAEINHVVSRNTTTTTI